MIQDNRNPDKASQRRVTGLGGSAAKGLFAVAESVRTVPGGVFVVLVTEYPEQAEELIENISFFLGVDHPHEQAAELPRAEVLYFPPWETLPYEPLSPHHAVTAMRLHALWQVYMEDAGNRPVRILVTTVDALAQKTIPQDPFLRLSCEILVEETRTPESIAELLVAGGYRSTGLVEEPGEFSLRGGIMDIYPAYRKYPVRIEFYGDIVESIRGFNTETQRSVESLEKFMLLPFREIGYAGFDSKAVLARVDELFSGGKIAREQMHELKTALETKSFFPGMEKYLHLFYPESCSIYDVLSDAGAMFIVDEPVALEGKVGEYCDLINTEYGVYCGRGRKESAESCESGETRYPHPEHCFTTQSELMRMLQSAELVFEQFSGEVAFGDPAPVKSLSGGPYPSGFESAVSDLKLKLQAGWFVGVVCSTRGGAERLHELLLEHGIYSSTAEDARKTARLLVHSVIGGGVADSGPEPGLTLIPGRLTEGVISADSRWMVVAEEELFGRLKRPRRKRKAGKNPFTAGIAHLNPGDIVVHTDHGIGKFVRFRQMTVGDSSDEYLEIEYAGNETLYLPMWSLHMLEKYSGGSAPSLDRLGGKTWARVKTKVKKNLLKMADDLLRTAAKRAMSSRPAYQPDGHYHMEFADAFEYEETADQEGSIKAVTADMEKERPMDRLVCGDVGYGKTEVAMRAAFKAVMDGRQVAVLVPTTILALQHLKTFKERFHAFPVKIEMLSRIRGKEESAAIMAGLESGAIEIIIGTHRLLGEKVRFKNLGLLVIDEEQRFGVSHKEKLKKLREGVDVLTLTATPIPRTLHQSLSGMRELSVIDTPPQNRQSIRTHVRRFDDDVISDAVARELERGGQIFFVHNRVESIYSMRQYLSRLMPKLRIGVGHGQLGERALEEVMLNFIGRELDMLLCTTIIESGLDIPAANTIIINRADKLGLAQLYQLRGRVGRDRHRAHCYLLIPGSGKVAPLARKRIQAIEELSELGSGFRLAARDMELRGAGNLLGPQQSGHIAAVGFEMYCRLLDEAVNETKGLAPVEEIEPQISIGFKGKIDQDYIPDPHQRMDIYQRLYRISKIDDIELILAEMRDRFGVPPEEAERLVALVELRVLCKQLRVTKVELSGGENVVLTFDSATPLAGEVLMAMVTDSGGGLRFASEDSVMLIVTPQDWRLRADELKKMLLRLIVKSGAGSGPGERIFDV